jgi:hypothetical protein
MHDDALVALHRPAGEMELARDDEVVAGVRLGPSTHEEVWEDLADSRRIHASGVLNSAHEMPSRAWF